MSYTENSLRYSIAERAILILCHGATGQIVDSSQKSLRATLLTDLILPHYFSISAVIQLSLHTNNPCIEVRVTDN